MNLKSERIDLSICIVSRNTIDCTKACLNSIYSSNHNLKIEIIVVDNASNDGTQELIQKEFPHVHLICNQENRFFSPANNQAIAISKGEFILFLNSDTEIYENSLERMVHFLRNHPEAGALTCQMVSTHGEILAGAARDYTLEIALLNYTFWGHFFPKRKKRLNEHLNYSAWDRSTTKAVDWITDANMMIKRTALESIGGTYDETMKMYYTENDICLRLKKKNYKIYYLAEGKVLHHERKSVSKEGVEMISKIYEKDTISFYNKHYGQWRTLILFLSIKFSNLLISILRKRPKKIFESFLKPAKK